MDGRKNATESSARLPRRSLFRAGAVVAGGAVAGSVLGTAPGYAATGSGTHGGRAVRPPALKAGDRVRIVAPAYPGDSRLVRGTQILESFGLVVEMGDHVYDTQGYLAGTDADRLADLNEAFRDPGVRCVFGARGGYGTQRIIRRPGRRGGPPGPEGFHRIQRSDRAARQVVAQRTTDQLLRSARDLDRLAHRAHLGGVDAGGVDDDGSDRSPS
jgi:hypothetical protein